MRQITNEHIEAYKTGLLQKLFNVIKEDPELSFEIREKNEVMAYYRKGRILTIKYKDKDHYKIKPLAKEYNDGKKLSVSFETKSLSETLNDTKKLRNYFKQAKSLIYKHKMGLEFGVQQNITLGNCSFANRFLVADMEWQFSQKAIDGKERVQSTRIDLLVIDTQPNKEGANDIYLTELKVGTKATDGFSGIEGHINKTNKIICYNAACAALKSDVESIIDIKSKLGLINGKKKSLNLSSTPKMMIILAYRGEEEKKQLEKQADLAIKAANKIGMSEPLIKYIDLRLSLV